MVVTGSAISVVYMALKDKKSSQGAISSYTWLSMFIYILTFSKDY